MHTRLFFSGGASALERAPPPAPHEVRGAARRSLTGAAPLELGERRLLLLLLLLLLLQAARTRHFLHMHASARFPN
jgi:hypothetical protein